MVMCTTDPLFTRLAALAEIADRRKDSGERLGKTAAQKLLYLLQESFDVPVGYRFRFYTYGPYDSAVMRDIDYGHATGILDVEYDEDRGYSIKPGSGVSQIAEVREDFGKQYHEQLDRLFALFGRLTARELELLATLVYVNRDDPELSRSDLCDRVKKLKPKYERCEIEKQIENLMSNKLISVNS
ncbi:MAG: hypothetical protein D6744_09280 [Planctomycetota bacterium]|nr:MAG: hypothetical protein D6744_09280 [Planctomycetota bacterium]